MVQKMFTFIKIKHLYLETSLLKISKFADENIVENDRFISQLKESNSNWIDAQIEQLNHEIEPQIDCTNCGNCCKTLMINVEQDEVQKASEFLGLKIEEFKAKFIEEGSSGRMIIESIPCSFLTGKKCSIYEARFGGCKEFPGLHLPNAKARLFTIMMHYDRCPIIFNVIEQLKLKTSAETD